MISKKIVVWTYVILSVFCGLFGASFNDVDQKVGVFILIVVLGLVYMAPSFIAVSRKSLSGRTVFCLNVFLSWTVLMWIVTLVIAISSKSEADLVNEQNLIDKHSSNSSDKLLKLAELKEKGILSEEEFNEQKKALLNS